MALINVKSYYVSKLNSLHEKIAANKEMLVLSKRLIKEENDAKYHKYLDNQNEKLYIISLGFADINEEVNKRIANAMLKYNKKDYWKRRELIQKMRVEVSNGATYANESFLNSMKELDEKKKQYEFKLKSKIKAKLSKFCFEDEAKRKEKLALYNKEKEAVNNRLQEYRNSLNADTVAKCEKLDHQNELKEEKLRNQIEKLQLKVNLQKHDYELPSDILLEVDHLTMQFGGLKAVDDLSFKVKKGEIFGLIGPNGAGKTTVFNCITQFYKPTKGNVYFKDRNGSTILLNDIMVHDVVKKGIVRTFQNVEVVKEVSVLDNLLIAAHTQYHSTLFDQFLHLPILKKEEIAIREKALEVLDFMGLTMYKDWLAWGLPYGVLKKIEIARTLMNNPQLIILDEPAAGLNDTETAELTKLIRKIQEKYKCTILLVEHDMGLVMDICDTVCAISFGKMLGLGTTTDIQNNKEVQKAYLGSDEEE